MQRSQIFIPLAFSTAILGGELVPETIIFAVLAAFVAWPWRKARLS